MGKFLKIICIMILVFQLSLSTCFANDSAYSFIVDYLLERSISYYNHEDLEQALCEFKKILLIQPDNKDALRYIQIIEKKKDASYKTKAEMPVVSQLESEVYRERIIKRTLDEMERSFRQQHLFKSSLLSSDISSEKEQTTTSSIKRAGEITLFIDGEEVFLESPPLLKKGEIFIPLREIARLFFFSLYELGEQRFILISPEGVRREIKVSYLEGVPVITLQELKDYFSVQSYYDDLEKIVYINKSLSPLRIYTVKRPQKEDKLEGIKGLREDLLEEDTSKQKPNYIPEIARPSVELNTGVSYTYVNYHILPPYKDMITSLSGRINDFEVTGFREDKEIAGKFDHATTWLNLEKPGFLMGLFDQGIDLYPLRGQYQGFTGIKLIWNKESLNRTTFLGGDIENYISGTTETVRYLGEVVGIEQEFWPVSWLGTRAIILYLENETELTNLSGTTPFPRRNIVNFFDTTLKLTPKLSFLTQLAHSYYRPDNTPDENVSDWNWRFGPELKSGRYNLRFAYEFVGDKYVSLGNPITYQDYKGWDLSGDYKIFDGWSISTYFTRYQDNVDEDPNRLTNKNQSFSISSVHSLPRGQSLNLLYNLGTSNPSGPDSGPSTKSNLYRADYFTSFLGHNFLFNYQYYRLDSSSLATLGYSSHVFGGTIFKAFGLGSTWNLHQEFTKTFSPVGRDRSDYNTSFSLYYRINPNLDFNFNPLYRWEKPEGMSSTQTISCSSGLWYKIFPDTSVRVDYSITDYNIKTEKNWPRNWSILLSLIKNFSFTSPAKFGTIKGRVLKDTNNNLMVDHSDEPVEAVKISLEDGRTTRTDKQGNFIFRYAIPQKQKIYLELGDLPLEWISQDVEKEISVSPFKTTEVKILLVKSSSIIGKVFIDENQDSIFQDSEEPVEGITIVLLPEEQIRITDEEGNFRFDNLLFGKYELRINIEDIPVGYELISDKTKDVILFPGEEMRDLNFTLRLKPTSSIQKF